jgi:hypothetical protein
MMPSGAENARSGHAIEPFHLVTAALLVLVALWMAEPVLWVFALVPRGYSEGWNAMVALRAMSDLPLYPQDQTLHTNNYPPLSFYLVGALGALVGDNIVAGRIVSLVGTVAIAGEIALTMRLLGAMWPVGTFAGLLFVGGAIGLDDRPIGGNEPHMLAHAVMLAGLVVLLARQDSRAHVVGAAVLMVVAGLIKHSLLGLPLAVTVWLLLNDRRAFGVWLAAASAASASALALLWLLYGASAFDNLLSERSYSLLRMMRATRSALQALQIPLAGSLFLMAVQPRDARIQLVGLYVAGSMLVTVVLVGGAGTGLNLFFDPMIALSLAAGLLLQRAGRWVAAETISPSRVRAALAAVLILGMALNLPGDPVRALLDPSRMGEAEAATRADVAFVAGLEGPVLCESLALCYWAGKKLEVDTFNARQGFLARRHDEQVLLDLLASGAFAAVQLTDNDPGRDDERISPAFMDSLHRHYRLARTSPNGAFFVPRSVR